MVLDVKSVLELLKIYTEKYGIPFPADRSALTAWSKGVDIPSDGEYMIFTGGLYQLMPYIEGLVQQLRKLDEKGLGGVAFRFAKRFAQVLDIAKLAAKPAKDLEDKPAQILTSIYRLLRAAGVGIYYIPEADNYSGAILYDMGLLKTFARHASTVYEALKREHVKKIVTVDPHTTYILRRVFPRYIKGFDIEVKNYLEILRENVGKLEFKSGNAGRVVIHDPCFYARYESLIEEPRILLKAAGYDVVEPRRHGRLTYCCGGPIESIAPKLSEAIARRRVEELKEYSDMIVVLCPICYLNLRRVLPLHVQLEDIAILLERRLIVH